MKRRLLVQIFVSVLLLVSVDLAALSTRASASVDDTKSAAKGEDAKDESKSIYATIEGIISKLREGRFGEVQHQFDRLIIEKPFTNSGSRMLEAIYQEMSYRRDILDFLDAWCKTEAAGHSSFLMRGMYHISDAWRARGGGFAYTVKDKDRRLMKERLLLAKQDLQKAFGMNPLDPNSAAAMIWVCIGLGIEKGTMEDWFQKAISSDVCAYYPYWNKLMYLAPKWHGSFEEFTSFAQSCYTNRPPCGRVYTVVMEYFFDCARSADDKKAFWLNPAVRGVTDDVLRQWLADFPKSTAARVSRAIVSEQIGKEAEAIALCSEALKIDPYDTYALSKRGDVYFNTDDFSAAESDFNQLLKISFSNDYALACLGKIYLYHHEDYPKAVDFFDRAIKLNDKESWYYSERGKANMQWKRYKEAVADLDSAIKADSRSGQAYYYRGVCLLALGQEEPAINDFWNARGLDPALRPKIDGRLRSHDPMRFFNTVLEEEPDNVEVLFGRAQRYLFLGDVEKAKEDLNRILKINPDQEKTYYELAKIALDKGRDYKLAIEYLDKAILINPKNKDYYSERGMAKHSLNDFASAGEDLSSAIKIGGGTAKNYYYSAQCKWKLNQIGSCREDFMKAKELDEGYRQSAERHLAELNAPRIEGSTAAANQMKTQPAPTIESSANPRLRELRESGMRFFAARNMEGAISDFTKILQQDPQNDFAVFMLGCIQSQLTKDFRKAIEYFDRALALNSREKKYFYEKGMAYFFLNDFANAKESFTSAVAIDDRDGKAYYHRGYCYWKLKEVEKAKEDFQKAKEFAPAYGVSVDRHLNEMGVVP